MPDSSKKTIASLSLTLAVGGLFLLPAQPTKAAGAAGSVSADNIAVFCNDAHKPTKVRVSGLRQGDTVRVYEAGDGKKLLGSSVKETDASGESLEINLEEDQPLASVFVGINHAQGVPEPLLKVPTMSAFAPSLEVPTLKLLRDSQGTRVHLKERILSGKGVSQIAMVFERKGTKGKGKEKFVELTKDAADSFFEGDIWLMPEDQGVWQASQLAVSNSDGERFVYVHSKESKPWISGNQEHLDLSAWQFTYTKKAE